MQTVFVRCRLESYLLLFILNFKFMKISLFRLNRKGVFKIQKSTANQCGIVGLTHYEYDLKLLLTNNLDLNGFVINHLDIEKAIQEAVLYGSCEEIQKDIYLEISFLFKEKNLLGYKCSIKPIFSDKTEVKAYLDFIVCQKAIYLSLLN